MDSSTHVGNISDTRPPKDGDLSMCLNCGRLHVRADNHWRPATSMEIAVLDAATMQKIGRMRQLRAEVIKADLSKRDRHT
jgi:hypothetical protein